MKTQIGDYWLWYDGDVEIDSKNIEQFISKVSVGKLYVNVVTDNINTYNKMLSKPEQIRIKTSLKPLNFDWAIPKDYYDIDLQSYLLDKLTNNEDINSDKELVIRIQRIMAELHAYEVHGLTQVLRCLIYIVDTFNKNGIVWGVGRGSSVSSYVLYLIGVHDIDSVLFNLPFTDFIKA
jgi:DNA polymerase III alpha subunit